MRISRFEFKQLHDFRQPVEALSFTDLVEEMEQEIISAPILPTYSEAQLNAAIETAHNEAFAEGVTKGLADAANDAALRERDIKAIITYINETLAEHQRFYQQFISNQCTELHAFVMAIARKVAGDALSSRPDIAIQELLSHCVPMIINKPRITLEVNPAMIELLEKRLKPHLEQLGFEGDILFRSNDRLQMSDAHIEWPSGRAQRDTQQLWTEIEAMLAQVSFAPSMHTTDTLASAHNDAPLLGE